MKVRMFDLRVKDTKLRKQLNFSFNKLLNHGKLFLGPEVEELEHKLSKFLNSKYVIGVSSGSSALYLALKALGVKKGDEVITTPLTWVITANAIAACGARPIFADVKDDFNIDPESIKNKITKKTKAIVLINVLGNSSNLFEIKKIARQKKLIIIEDNCESLGSKLKGKYLGTFGDFSTFSFYYSHQITSGEGGMITCKNDKDYEILFSLRSHGWFGGARFYSRKTKSYNKYAKKYSNLDPRYIFSNSGFNLRPTDIQAAIAHNQFKRLNKLKRTRNINRNLIIDKITKSDKWNNQFSFFYPVKNLEPSWMGLPILLNKKYKKYKKNFIDLLDNLGIETRPIISGSFVNQPASRLYKLNPKNFQYPNAQIIQELGFLIGLHTKRISKKNLNLIHNAFFKIDNLVRK